MKRKGVKLIMSEYADIVIGNLSLHWFRNYLDSKIVSLFFSKNDLIVVNNCNIDDNDKDAGTYTKYMYRTTVRRAKERLDAQGFGLNNFEKIFNDEMVQAVDYSSFLYHLQGDYDEEDKNNEIRIKKNVSLKKWKNAMKYELIAKVWNRYTSTFTEREQVQYQGIFQGFRMVGTQSKLGKRYPVKAFETGERVTIEYLNGYLMDKSKAVTDFHYKSDLSLAEARKKYPEWYEKRIVQGERRERWHIKRDLYDWWLRKIKEGASVGHRYSCLCVLASYAVKCDIPEDELFTDAFSLLQFLDDMSDDEHNRFTKRDIMDAMQFYQENYVTYSRSEAERVSAIPMPANKRNYQKQADHLEEARAIRDIRMKRQDRDWREGNGRPKGSGEKSKIVEEWQRQHPDGKKADCIRETGLSKPTVYKWWK